MCLFKLQIWAKLVPQPSHMKELSDFDDVEEVEDKEESLSEVRILQLFLYFL